MVTLVSCSKHLNYKRLHLSNYHLTAQLAVGDAHKLLTSTIAFKRVYNIFFVHSALFRTSPGLDKIRRCQKAFDKCNPSNKVIRGNCRESENNCTVINNVRDTCSLNNMILWSPAIFSDVNNSCRCRYNLYTLGRPISLLQFFFVPYFIPFLVYKYSFIETIIPSQLANY